MRVSGFTFVKNANKLYIPAKEAITSILPICDEFIVAVGDADPEEGTLALIQSIDSEKIKIIQTEWDTDTYSKNTVFARETDKAKQACSGDWLFYIQCDEAVHESYLPTIKSAMEKYLQDVDVEGFVFRYKHFWGDYEHYNNSHVLYDNEVRIIRNLPEIHSWKDAQSFRYFEKFDYSFSAYQNTHGRALRVAKVDAEIYHYGWVRPPDLMNAKRKLSSVTYRGANQTEQLFASKSQEFDYGAMGKLPVFKGTHPAVMREWISKHDWKAQLNYTKKRNPHRPPEKHERLKYEVLSWIEHHLLRGKRLGAFKNYKVIRK